MKKEIRFIQIAIGSVMHGLDEQGRVWIFVGKDGWRLLNMEITEERK